MNPAADALYFVLDTLISCYIGAIAIRFILQTVRADYYNPLVQFIVKITNPVLVPARRIIPGFGGWDVAALLVCTLLIFGKFMLFKLMGLITFPANFFFLLGYSLIELIDLFFSIFFFAIFVMAVISWVAPDPNNPAYGVVSSIAEPVVKPFRRIIPPISGIDLSPMAAIIALQASKMIIIPVLKSLLG